MLVNRFSTAYGEANTHQFVAFLKYLHERGIVVEYGWAAQLGLTPQVLASQERQLNFLLDLLGSPQLVAEAQHRILRASIVIFGIGAVGTWLVRLLLGLGFRNFTLLDHDSVSSSDVARHAFPLVAGPAFGTSKVDALARHIEAEFPGASVRPIHRALSPTLRLDNAIDRKTTLAVNTADEPYIGFTSVLISRFCISRRLPLLVAGGFDAHLASIGELIIPGVTPCADCYATHFEGALADWKPATHPVADGAEGAGGLCSLSVFAAATAALSVLRYVGLGAQDNVGGRSELLFDDYRLTQFRVARRPDCPVCRDL